MANDAKAQLEVAGESASASRGQLRPIGLRISGKGKPGIGLAEHAERKVYAVSAAA